MSKDNLKKLLKLDEVLSAFSDDLCGLVFNGYYYNVRQVMPEVTESYLDSEDDYILDETVMYCYDICLQDGEIGLKERNFTLQELLDNKVVFFYAQELESPYLNEGW